MKLFYIANIRFPTEKAHGIQIIKMVQALAQSGMDVSLVIPTRKNHIKQGVFEYYNLPRTFPVIYLPTIDPQWLFKFPAGLYIKGQGWLFMRALKKFLRQNLKNNDVLFTRDEYLLPLLTNYSNKLICEVHNLPRRAEYYTQSWNQCHKVIAISQALQADLIKSGVQKNKIEILPDAVDVDMFDINVSQKEARQRLDLPLDKKIILINSSLYPWKGVYTLAESAKYLNTYFNRYLNRYLIVMIGAPESEKNKLAQFIKQNKLPADNIILAGHKPYELIPYYLKAADVLVLPTTNQQINKSTNFDPKYTSPLKLFEYLASGRPIVASDLPALREILTDQNALFFKPDNAQDLAEKIKLLLKDPDYQKVMQQANPTLARSYTWQNRAKKIISFLNQT